MTNDDGPLLVILDRSRLEDFWSEQALLLEKRNFSTFEDCLALQSGLLENFFGVTIRVNDEVSQDVDMAERDTINAPLTSDKGKVNRKSKKRKKMEEEFAVKEEKKESVDFLSNEENKANEDDIEFSTTVPYVAGYSNIDISEDKSFVSRHKADGEKGQKKAKRQKRVKKEESRENIDFCSVKDDQVDFEGHLEEQNSGQDDSVSRGSEQVYQEASYSGVLEELEVKCEPLQPRFNCTFCGTDQKSYKKLKKHVDDDHLRLSYHCNLCEFTSNDKDASMDHMEVEHDQKKNLDQLNFECGICKFKAEIQEHSDHVLLDHPEFSDFLFDAIDEDVQVVEESQTQFPAEMKVERDEDQRWPCTICGFRAADKHTLRVHVEMNHLNIRYECTVCGMNTKEMYIVRNHTVKEHGDERMDTKLLDYCCGICSFRGLKKPFLEHLFADHPEFGAFFATHGKSQRGIGKRSGECKFCKMNFACNLPSHIDTVHLRATYTCALPTCEHRSKVKRSTMEHLEMEHLPAQFRAEDGKVSLEGRSWIRRNVEYICSQCDLTIKSHSDLLNHMTSEHQDAIIIQKELPCSKCPLVFHSKASRSEHMEVHKTDEESSSATCDTCGHVGSNESNLRVHIMMKHMKARFTCLACKKQFKFPSECRSHIKKFHSEEDTGMECVCNKCGLPPTSFEEFTSHAVSEHSMPNKGRRGGNNRVAKTLASSEGNRFCRYCDFSSTSPSPAKVHMDLFHIRTNYSCQVCDFSSKAKLDVIKHIQSDHKDTVDSNSAASLIFYHCAVCELADGRDQFLEHLAGHSEEETSLSKEEVEEEANYSCTRCPTFKNDKTSTISHIISEHMGEHDEDSGVSMQEFVTGLLLMNCRFCPFSGSLVDFYSHTTACLSRMAPLEAAQDHRSFNLPENENACTFCGAEVASREGMESHILFKHLKAALTCSPCGLKLKNKSNSLKHIAEKHKDAEPSSCISIQCGLCSFQSLEREFSSHMDTDHIEQMEVEEPIEPATCNQCDFTATSKAKLTQHKKSAHVKLVCLRCDNKPEFPDKKKLNQHNIHVHQEKIHCNDCSFSTKHKTALQRHKETVHEGKRKYPCSIGDCERDFTRNEYLLLHHKKDHLLAA